MVAVGGGTKSDFWLQIMANACNIRIARTYIGQQAGSLGSAALAAVGAGLWKDFDRIDEIHQLQYTATPQDRDAAIYEKLLPLFRLGAQQQAKLGDMLAELEL